MNLPNQQNRNAIAIAVASIGTLISFALVVIAGGLSFNATLVLLGVLAATIGLRKSQGIQSLILLTLYQPLIFGSYGNSPSLFPIDLLFTLSLLSLGSWGFRLVDLISLDRGEFVDRSFFENVKIEPAKKYTNVTSPTGGNFLLLILALVLSMVTLWMIPFDRMSPKYVGLLPTPTRAIAFLWFLSLWVALSAFLAFYGWRRIDRDQAGVYIRSTLAKEIGNEHGAIERSLASVLRWKKLRKIDQ